MLGSIPRPGYRYAKGLQLTKLGAGVEALTVGANVAAGFFDGFTMAAMARPARVKPIVRSAICASVNEPGKPYQFQYGTHMTQAVRNPIVAAKPTLQEYRVLVESCDIRKATSRHAQVSVPY